MARGAGVWIVVAVLFIVCSIAFTACAPVAKSHPPASPNGMLWKVEKGGHSTWLFGSVHMATPDLYPLPAGVDSAFANSMSLAVDVAIDSLDAGELAQQISQWAVYPPGDSLPNHIPQELLVRLDSVLDSMALPLSVFHHMRPWAIGVQIGTEALAEQSMDPELGIDVHFLKQARSRNIPVYALESALSQAMIFKDLPDSTEARWLSWNLKDLKEIDTTISQVVRAWKEADIATLEQVLFGEEFAQPGLEELRERIYTRRNRTMADSIAVWTDEDRKVFVVVGAAHLIGKEGIPALLQAQGYRISGPSTVSP